MNNTLNTFFRICGDTGVVEDMLRFQMAVKFQSPYRKRIRTKMEVRRRVHIYGDLGV